MNLTDLPDELIIHQLSFVPPIQLWKVMEVNKLLYILASDDKVWLGWFHLHGLGLYERRDNVSLKDTTMQIIRTRRRVKKVVEKIYSSASLSVRLSFNAGVSVQKLKDYERERQITLPSELREYFLMMNGQDAHGRPLSYVLLPLEDCVQGDDRIPVIYESTGNKVFFC